MKILQINAVYPVGSTGKIVNDIHTQLIEHGHESIICYGRGIKVKKNNIYKIAPEFIMKLQSLRSKLTGYAYAGCYYSTYKLIHIIEKEKPDIVHLHCINSYIVNIYKLLNYLKKNNFHTVLTLHAEFMYTAGCGYAIECNKWKSGCNHCPQKGKGRPSSKIFDRSAEEWGIMQKAYGQYNNIIIVSVSKWLYNRASESPFYKDKQLEIVLNGIDTDNTFKPTDVAELKSKFNIESEKIVLHVTANFSNPIKGGKYVLELAKRLGDENIRFFIIGLNSDKGILPRNVTAIPSITDQKELAAFYSLADLTVLTSKKETFSMICAESLACGTPVVGFEAGAPETIALKQFSKFVQQGNIDELDSCVRQWVDKKQEFGDLIYKEASRTYSKELMFEKYCDLYKRWLK